MPSLPTELYRPIVNLITDQPTLYALLFVSSVFNYEAERMLYRRLSPTDTEVREKLYQHLQTCERVAKLVLELDVMIPIRWSSLSISLTLRSLINLKTLTIWNTFPNAPMAHILDGCLFQLESFRWPYPAEQQLVHFLENQPRIRRLDLYSGWDPSEFQISSNALPRLLILTASANTFNVLLAGRKVTHLFWDPDPFDDEPDLARIGPALNSIRVLKYGNSSTLRLHTVIDYLGKLEVLEWNQLNYQDIIDNAPLSRNLWKVILPFTRCMPADPEKFIQKLFAVIPTLRLVDLGLEKSGLRWSRDRAEPEPIPMQSHDWMFY